MAWSLGKFKRFTVRILVCLAADLKSLFGVSFLLGIFLAVLFHKYQESNKIYQLDHLPRLDLDHVAYRKWLLDQNLDTSPVDPDVSRYGNSNLSSLESPVVIGSESEFLYNRISVACLVFPTDFDNAATIRNTWGRHCNKLYFFHHIKNDTAVPIIRLQAASSFELLCSALHHAAEDSPDLSWILVTTENTYALPENLRYFVASMREDEPHYLGHAMKFWSTVYNWGEAGYALNKPALHKLFTKFKTKEECSGGGKYWKNGDWYLGKHFHQLGIDPVDTRDYAGKGRFNGYSFKKLLFPGAVSLFERYWKDSLYFSSDGPSCCSNFAITFNGIASKSKMYQLEYLFYHLRPFPRGGVNGNRAALPPPKQIFLTEEEKRKEEELEKWFNAQLTTPGNMAELYAHLFDEADD